MSRNLNPNQIAALVEEKHFDVDTDDSLDDPDFFSLSDTGSSSEETESEEETDNNPISRLDTFTPLQPQAANQVQPTAVNQVMDRKQPHNFSPKHTVSSEQFCQITFDLWHLSSPLDCFMMECHMVYGCRFPSEQMKDCKFMKEERKKRLR